MKRPSFQFYPGDWLRDTALRSCSVAARGLWIEMMAFMHEGTPYGYLKVGRKVILPINLASMVGATLVEVEGWLTELEAASVYSKDGDCIFSRRMVRDEEIRIKRASGGHLGGNPALIGRLTLPPNLPTTPSSSSSSSSSSSELSADSNLPTLEDVKTSASMQGIKPDLAQMFFEHYEGNNLWLNQHGRLINWRVKLKTWSENERTMPNGSKTGQRPNPRNAGVVGDLAENARRTKEFVARQQ